MLRGLPLPTDAVRFVVVPDPAAGAQWSFVFRGGYQFLLLAVRGVLTTAANIIMRYPSITFDFAGRQFPIEKSVGIPATTAITCNWTPGQAFVETGVPNSCQMTLPYPIIFQAGESIYSNVVNMNANDQWNNIFVYYLQMPQTQ
jgi:hypothetical protein